MLLSDWIHSLSPAPVGFMMRQFTTPRDRQRRFAGRGPRFGGKSFPTYFYAATPYAATPLSPTLTSSIARPRGERPESEKAVVVRRHQNARATRLGPDTTVHATRLSAVVVARLELTVVDHQLAMQQI